MRLRAINSVVNRYYDPSTDQFLSIDPYVATTDQPYVFTNDNPLNYSDPLGLKIQGTGSAACDIQDSNTDIGIMACNGETSGGRSVLGVIIDTPTVEFSVMVGTVTTSSSISITGAYGVSVGSDGVTVTSGGKTATFGYDGSLSGSINLPGASSLAFTNGGLAITTSQRSSFGGDKVETDTTATFYPSSGQPPPAIDIAYGIVGVEGGVTATLFAIWMWGHLVCLPAGPVALAC